MKENNVRSGVLPLIIIGLLLIAGLPQASATPQIWEVEPGDDIQAVIDNASDGDTILLLNGHHVVDREWGIVIDKDITLMGEDREETILIYRGLQGIALTRCLAQVSRLTIFGGFSHYVGNTGIAVGAMGTMINNVIVQQCNVGITFFESGCYNTVRDSLIRWNGCGILMYRDWQALNPPCGNVVFRNRFINNNNHVFDENIYEANNYDNGAIGNYWDDIEHNPGYASHMYFISYYGTDHYPIWDFPHSGKNLYEAFTIEDPE